jgi:2-polyprenyl-6-methoxyphenol hydroxylase-like FAD-dependent oxidoreductase
MKAVIIGGGIGGLMTGITLINKGLEIEIYERAPEIAEVGAGIWMAPNALNILKKYGLAEKVISEGKSLRKALIQDLHGYTVLENNFEKLSSQYGFTTTAIHRGRLQKILYDEIPKNKIFTNKECMGVLARENNIEANFADGTSASGDILIAADGIHSNIRRQLYPYVTERYARQLCCRFLAPFTLPEGEIDNMIEIWGNDKGLRCGYSYIDSGRVYVYITIYQKNNTSKAPRFNKAVLLNICRTFPTVVKQLIEAADEGNFIYDYLCDLPLSEPWVKDHIVLMGDAAHASTPNLGQGACQAIEDAYALGLCLGGKDSVESSLKRYESKRTKKAKFIRDASWKLSQVTNLDGWKKSLAKKLLHLLPASIQKQQADKMLSIDYLDA